MPSSIKCERLQQLTKLLQRVLVKRGSCILNAGLSMQAAAALKQIPKLQTGPRQLSVMQQRNGSCDAREKKKEASVQKEGKFMHGMVDSLV